MCLKVIRPRCFQHITKITKYSVQTQLFLKKSAMSLDYNITKTKGKNSQLHLFQISNLKIQHYRIFSIIREHFRINMEDRLVTCFE